MIFVLNMGEYQFILYYPILVLLINSANLMKISNVYSPLATIKNNEIETALSS